MRRALGYALVSLLLAGCTRHRIHRPAAVVEVEVARTADALTNERELAMVLEVATAGLPDLSRMESVSTDQGATLRLEFKKGDRLTLLDALDKKLEAARTRLPEGADAPTVRMVEDDAQPPLQVTLANPSLSETQLRTLADTKLRQTVLQTPGVVDLDRCGGLDPTLEVDVDSVRAAAAHVGLDAIASALQQATSVFSHQPRQSLETLGDLSLGGELHLRDVAQVRDGQRSPGCAALDGGKRKVIDEIHFGPLATKENVEALRQRLEQLRATLPPGSRLEVLEAAPHRLTIRAPEGFDGAALTQRLAQAGTGRALLRLSDPDPRREGTLELWTEHEPALDSLGVNVVAAEHQGVRRGLRVDVCGADLAQLRPLAAQVTAQLGPGAWTELAEQQRKQLEVDRNRMSILGVQPRELDLAASAAQGPVEVTLAIDGPVALPVLLRTDLPLEKAIVVAGPGAVRVLDVAQVKLASEPALIRRVDRERCIPSYVAPPAGEGAAWLAGRKRAVAEKLKLPPGTVLVWSE